ncbi:MAG: hypothetical protein GY898_25755 [Proteobacteria bacterium]|nr:hypothetical protein [Pseudomonadota bacterium]
MTALRERRAATAVLAAWFLLWVWTVVSLQLEHEHIKDELGHIDQVLRMLAGTATFADADLAYPPLWRTIASGSSGLFGVSRWALALPGLLACLATLGATALLVPERSRWRVVLLLAPALIPFSYRVTTESLVTLTVAGTATALAYAARRPNGQTFAFVAVGLTAALLAKQTTPLFLLIPVLWCGWSFGASRDARGLFGLLGALVLAGAGAWFGFYRHVGVLETVADAFARGTTGPTSAADVGVRLLLYPGLLALFLGIPAVLAAARRPVGMQAVWWSLAVAVPLVGLMVFPVQEKEYLLPVVPLAVAGIVSLLDGVDVTGRAVPLLLVVWVLGVTGAVGQDRVFLAVYADGQSESLDGLTEAWRAECPEGCSACVLTARRRGHAASLVQVGLRSRDGEGLSVSGRCDARSRGIALVFHGWDAPDEGGCVSARERAWYVEGFEGEPSWSGNGAAFDRIVGAGVPLAKLPPGPEGPPAITVCRLP